MSVCSWQRPPIAVRFLGLFSGCCVHGLRYHPYVPELWQCLHHQQNHSKQTLRLVFRSLKPRAVFPSETLIPFTALLLFGCPVGVRRISDEMLSGRVTRRASGRSCGNQSSSGSPEPSGRCMFLIRFSREKSENSELPTQGGGCRVCGIVHRNVDPI